MYVSSDTCSAENNQITVNLKKWLGKRANDKKKASLHELTIDTNLVFVALACSVLGPPAHSARTTHESNYCLSVFASQA